MNRKKEAGFTLVEVMIAVAILSFAIFATVRIITASLGSITRQGQRVQALHLAQAYLTKIEAKFFFWVVPETWTIPDTPYPSYQLGIYNPNVSPSEILVPSDNNYWYDDDNPDTENLGFDDSGQDKSDGILVANKDGTPYTKISTPPLLSEQYIWDSKTLTLTFSSANIGEEIQIYYRYYHFVEEGGTIPSSDAEGLKKGTIKLITDVGDTNGNGTPGEEGDILGENLTADESLSPSDYESFDGQTRELTFVEAKEESSVWIYYLPGKSSDTNGDGYEDPEDKSILGVVKGNFCNLDGSPTNKTTDTKKVSVTEYWKQGENIQSAWQKTYVTRETG